MEEEQNFEIEPTAFSVRVAVRFRPLNAKEEDKECVVVEGNEVSIGDKKFTFDHCFDATSTQEQVFETLVSPLLDSFFKGYNATILAYGQTGSGKTYTMGTTTTAGIVESKAGIVARAINKIFEFVEEQQEKKDLVVKATFIEIYNDEIRDLLEVQESHRVSVREEKGHGIVLVGATEKVVLSASEMSTLLEIGSVNRVTHSTGMNDTSSRSHAIFSIIVEQKAKEPSNSTSQTSLDEAETDISDYTSSKFHFVDLAGSERIKKTKTEGDRMKEGIAINSELLVLGNVISALGDPTKQASHVPYRDSKLTRLLQDSLGGNSRTQMIACASPADINFSETMSTLRYANRARNIQNKPVINRDPLTALIKGLREEVKSLKAQLQAVTGGAPIHNYPIHNPEYSQNRQLPSTTTPNIIQQHNNNNLFSSEEKEKLINELNEKKEENEKLKNELNIEKGRSMEYKSMYFKSEASRKICIQKLQELGQAPPEATDIASAKNQNGDPNEEDDGTISTLADRLEESQRECEKLKKKIDLINKIMTRKQRERVAKKSSPRGRVPSVVGGEDEEFLEANSELTGEDEFEESDEAFAAKQESEEHAAVKKLLEHHYEALSEGVEMKEGLSKHLAEKSQEYSKIEQELGTQIETTISAIKYTEKELEQVEAQLLDTNLQKEEEVNLRAKKDENERILGKLKEKLIQVENEKTKLKIMKESSDRKVAELQNEIVFMKKEKVELNKKLREELKNWNKFREEQQILVKQLQKKVDDSLRQAEEAKKKEKETQMVLEKIESKSATLPYNNSNSFGSDRNSTLKRNSIQSSGGTSSAQLIIKRISAPKRSSLSMTPEIVSPLSTSSVSSVSSSASSLSANSTSVVSNIPNISGIGSNTGSFGPSTARVQTTQAVVLWKKWLREDGIARVVELRQAADKLDRERHQCFILETRLASLRQSLDESAERGANIDDEVVAHLEAVDEEIAYRKSKIDRQQELMESYELSAPKEPVAIDSLILGDARAVCHFLYDELVEAKIDKEDSEKEIAKLNEDFIKCQEEIEQLKMGRPMERLIFEEQKTQLQKEHAQQLMFFMKKVEELKVQLINYSHQRQQNLEIDDQNLQTALKKAIRENPDILWQEIDELRETRERKYEELEIANEELSNQVSLLSNQLVKQNGQIQTIRRIAEIASQINKDVQHFAMNTNALKQFNALPSFGSLNEVSSSATMTSTSGKKMVTLGPTSRSSLTSMNFVRAPSKTDPEAPSSARPKSVTLKRPTTSGSVFERLANPANFPAANPMASASRAVIAEKGQQKEAEKKKRDMAVQLKSKFTQCGTLQGHGGSVNGVICRSNVAFTCSHDTTIKVWDAASEMLLCTMSGHSGIVRTIAWCDKGFLLSGSFDRTIKLWDPRQNECFHTIKNKQMTELCTLATSGTTIYAGSEDAAIRIWDARKMEEGELQCIQTLQEHKGSVFALLKTNDYLFSGSRDHTIKVWNTSSYRCQQDLTFHYDTITCLMEMKGMLISGSRDKSIKVFCDGYDSAPISIDSTSYPTSSHSDFVLDLKKTMDESLFVSCGKDGLIKVWDFEKLGCGATIKVHSGPVHSLSFMDNDNYLLSASQDRTVCILKHEQLS